jgi:hypothetical protein
MAAVWHLGGADIGGLGVGGRGDAGGGRRDPSPMSVFLSSRRWWLKLVAFVYALHL